MNQSLKSKRDTLADKYVFKINGHRWSNNDNTAGDNFGSYKAGFNDAIQAVIELLGEFDEKETVVHFNKIEGDEGFYDEETAIVFSRWQHEQILNKLRGES
ncbi:MAG: hypothetical protein ACK5T9_02880 [Bacteroidota bacterium]